MKLGFWEAAVSETPLGWMTRRPSVALQGEKGGLGGEVGNVVGMGAREPKMASKSRGRLVWIFKDKQDLHGEEMRKKVPGRGNSLS